VKSNILLLAAVPLIPAVAPALGADTPVAVFDASKSNPAAQGWTGAHDRPGEALMRLENNALRIEDDDDQGKDRFFHFDLSNAHREVARRSGFTATWRLRIPEDTGGVTRAISTEVCVASSDQSDTLRFGLQLGRCGNNLAAGIHAGTDGWIERSCSVADGSALHEWTLVFDGKSEILNLLVDGELMLSARIDHRDRGHDLVFGSRSGGMGISEWAAFRFFLGTGDWKLRTPVPAPRRVTVLSGGQGGYHAYRIPSLIVAPNGDLLVFCEARKTDLSDDGDIDLVATRSRDGGKTWPPHTLVYEEGGDAKIKYGNPTAVVDVQKGVIWLAANRDYLTAKGRRAGGALILFRSDDSGATWSKPIDITSSVKQPDWGHHAFGPGIGIQIQHGQRAGRLVLPGNFRRSFDKSKPSYSHIIFSDDHGKTWKLGGVLGDYTNECQVAETVEDGRSGLLINMRNHWGRGGVAEKSGKRLVARSCDGGETWSAEQMDPALPEPPCQASLLRYSFASSGARSVPGVGVPPSGGSVLLFANPAGAGRKNLTVRASRDEGRTWPIGRLLAPGPAAYSCLARLPDGRVGAIVETHGYRQLVFVAFDLSWLEE